MSSDASSPNRDPRTDGPSGPPRRSRIAPARTHTGLAHADGRSASEALARWHAWDRSIFALPIDAAGRIARGLRLAEVLDRYFDPALSTWVTGLDALLPGRFHRLPGGDRHRCEFLYVPTDDVEGEEIVMALECAADGTFDLRVSRPSLDVFARRRLGIPRTEDERIDEAFAVEALALRVFGERGTLFGCGPRDTIV